MTPSTVPRRAAWGIADQAFSSLTNFALSAIVARHTDPVGFGRFALIFSSYLIVLGLVRSATTLPLLVRFSHTSEDDWRDATAAAIATAIILGVVAGVVCVVGGLIFQELRGSLVALAITLPGLLLQETWRHAFIAQGAPVRAFLNDLLWAVVLVPAIAIAVRGEGSVPSFVLAWGVAGSDAGAVGMAQARVRPSIGRVRAWLRDHRDLSQNQVGEFLANTGSLQLVMYGAGAIVGLQAAGALRGAQVLLGPLHVAFQGAWIIGLSELVRVLRRRPRTFTTAAITLSAVVGAGGVAYVLLFLAFGDRVGPELLGATWTSAETVFLPMGIAAIATGLWLGASVGLRALEEARTSFRLRLIVSSGHVVGAFAGMAIADVRGAAWGLATTFSIGVAIWWLGFRSARARRVASERATDGDAFPAGAVVDGAP